MKMKGSTGEYEEKDLKNLFKASLNIQANQKDVEESLDQFVKMNSDLVVSVAKKEGDKIVFDIGQNEDKPDIKDVENKIKEFYDTFQFNFKVNSNKVKVE